MFSLALSRKFRLESQRRCFFQHLAADFLEEVGSELSFEGQTGKSPLRKGSASQAMERCVQGPEGTAGEDEVVQEGQRDWRRQGPELAGPAGQPKQGKGVTQGF
ncbi:unnamed protein product [Rangifer tarandus platyrhynchus]|uniref:Uncharacterized protein n=2 Tax=Rangifer tarandus platyrhynchus TaxID=3082113 RepID=A0ABN8Z9N0_RANTA|nr:unnamed protein product [Rangifer tarandus platyrhynchus]